MLEVRNILVTAFGATGITGCVPLNGMGRPGPSLTYGPMGRLGSPIGPATCVVSFPFEIPCGIRVGSIMRPMDGTIATPRVRPPCGCGAGPGSLLPKVIGVETVVRPEGSPTVVNSGISNSSPTITACSPNDVSVIQLRRPRSAQEVSSKLSANMMSSSVNSCLLLWTPREEMLAQRAQKIKAAS